jgi:hypothetical protein
MGNNSPQKTIPANSQTKGQVIDAYFLEHRAKLLDLAAYLDRIDRASGTGVDPDFRDQAFRQALQILQSDQPLRVKRILEILSVVDDHIPQSAEGMKGAAGAPRSARPNG